MKPYSRKKERHLLNAEKYREARAYIRPYLKQTPDDHYFLAIMSLTYYDQYRYKKAYQWSLKALAVAPTCSLALCQYAGILDMLDREQEAIVIWKKLLMRGMRRVAFGQCGEGLRWAESLLNDCRYRLGLAYAQLGAWRQAKYYMQSHLKHRRPGLPSTYTKKMAENHLKRIVRDSMNNTKGIAGGLK